VWCAFGSDCFYSGRQARLLVFISGIAAPGSINTRCVTQARGRVKIDLGAQPVYKLRTRMLEFAFGYGPEVMVDRKLLQAGWVCPGRAALEGVQEEHLV